MAVQIRSLDVRVLNLALFAPFGISGGSQDMARNALVRVELADGTVGWGEGAPLPAYNGETQDRVMATLVAARAAVVGREFPDWRVAAAAFRDAGGSGSGSAQAGFEIALLDAVARAEGRSLTQVFGGAGSELETDMTVTTGSAADAAIAARDIRQRRIRLIKVKVGGKAGPAHDLARLVAIREVAPDAPLILDGNAGLSRADAQELVRGLKAAAIAPALLEQWLPKDDLAGMRALAAESGWPVAADEAACTVADVTKIAAERAAQFVNIKVMKAGLSEAWDLALAAKRAGLGLMIGGNVESILAMTASACFACGVGGFTYADLDTPLFLKDNPFTGGFALDGGRISVAHIHAGHGVVPA